MQTSTCSLFYRTGRAAALAAGLAAAVTLSPAVQAAPAIGVPAPEFSGRTTSGETISLSGLRGKTVILEWTNHECPYVGKHYGTGNMQSLQKESTGDGVVWLSIISSAPGRQGYVEADEADRLTEERDAAPTHVILDPEGSIGKLYGARTTPHMYVIDVDGMLRYMGGIDDRPTARHSDVAGAKNFVRAALTDMRAGREVSTPIARAYGCSVKYGS